MPELVWLLPPPSPPLSLSDSESPPGLCMDNGTVVSTPGPLLFSEASWLLRAGFEEDTAADTLFSDRATLSATELGDSLGEISRAVDKS